MDGKILGSAALGLFNILATAAVAAWPSDSLTNVPVCIAPFGQMNVRLVEDGAGGAIAIWLSRDNLPYYDLYARRIRADGTADPAWPTGGLPVCTALGDQYLLSAVADGEGGALVAWEDHREASPKIYASHLLASGVVDPRWPANGLRVCAGDGDQGAPSAAPDGAGGVVVAWWDRRSGPARIFTQHLLPQGVIDPDWPLSGLALSASPRFQYQPRAISDGAGGAIVVWIDSPDQIVPWRLYAQRVRAGGAVDPAWPMEGRALCTFLGDQVEPAAVSDGAGGAIVAWQDARSPGQWDIYSQRVVADGSLHPDWPEAGRAVCLAGEHQTAVSLAADGAGGVFAVWMDLRTGVGWDVYAHHLDGGGALNPLWPVDGLGVCRSPELQVLPSMVPDGRGGAIVAWRDHRDDIGGDIYAHHLRAPGALDSLWPTNGRAVCAAPRTQANVAIVPDGLSGAILAWEDQRGGYDLDVYAQRIGVEGVLGGVLSVESELTPRLALGPVRPNPSPAPRVSVSVALGSGAAAVLEVVDVSGRRWLRRESLETARMETRHLALDLGPWAPPGVYFVSLRQGGEHRVRRFALLR